MIYRTENTTIDGQAATLHVFPAPINIGDGDQLAVHFAGKCYKFQCLGSALLYGIRNDGMPVELRNGSFITCDQVHLEHVDAEVTDHQPIRTFKCPDCAGDGEYYVRATDTTIACERCGGEGRITQ